MRNIFFIFTSYDLLPMHLTNIHVFIHDRIQSTLNIFNKYTGESYLLLLQPLFYLFSMCWSSFEALNCNLYVELKTLLQANTLNIGIKCR